MRVGRRLLRVPADGVLRLRARYGRPGLRTIRASMPDYLRGRASIRVIR